MESVFRTANAEEPGQTDREHGGKRKEKDCAPGNFKLLQQSRNAVADERANAVGHAVPDDTTTDILTCQKSRLDIEDIAPKHTLRKAVDEPDIFHRLNGRRKRDTEVTERGNDHRDRYGILGITVFCDKCVDELTCRIAEKVK